MSTILTLSEPLSPQTALLKRFGKEFPGLKQVSSQRVAYVEVGRDLNEDEQKTIHALLLSGMSKKATHHDFPHAKLFEIAYQPAIMDPERIAIDKMLGTIDFQEAIEEVKLSTVYAFEGVTEEEAKAIVHKYLFNGQLHVLIPHDHQPASLKIESKAEPMEVVEGFREMNLRQLKELSEQKSLYMEDDFLLETQRKFRDDLKRDPTDAELEYVAQRTSDHCFHTTWKSLGLFKKLKSEVDKVLPKRKDIVSVFVDNLGSDGSRR